MTGFSGFTWVKELWSKTKSLVEKAKWQSLSNKLTNKQEWKIRFTRIYSHKWSIIYSISAMVLIGSITLAGHQYIRANMVEVQHVLLDGQDIGIVQDERKVKDYLKAKQQAADIQFPNIHMVVQVDRVDFRSEKAFKKSSDAEAVLSLLDEKLVPIAVGVELKVDGKFIGVVKDKETVESILEQIKEPFIPKKKDANQVGILSADASAAANASQITVEKVEFVQKVEENDVTIVPQDLNDPKDIIKKLQTGDVQPLKYTVAQGDCVSCIAKKFGISKQFIYQKNPWINDDKIKVGNQLDLTVLQPTLTVKTVEKVVENQEVQYDTEYVKDDSLRAGVVQRISSGKNGLKKVAFQVTKVNGQMMEEQVLNEEMIQNPVTAKMKKGTKVVLGEGSGKFAWPVVSPSISSTFGMRWGKLHKGIDITGNMNILAADNGRVASAGYRDDYGNYVLIDHMNGYKTMYGHLSKIFAVVGKVVEKGEKIGYMGASGDAMGVHVHFEIQKSDVPENPLKYLNR